MTSRVLTAASSVLLLCTLSACGSPPPEEQETEVKGGVSDLSMMKKDIMCTVSHTQAYGTLNGTVYVSRSGDVAGDFTMTGTPLGTVEFHMIRTGGYAYSWGIPSKDVGIKVKAEEGKAAPKNADASMPDLDESMSYRCTGWTADAAKFALPASVTFREPQEFMNDAAAKCSACDAIPNPAGQQSCRKALGC